MLGLTLFQFPIFAEKVDIFEAIEYENPKDLLESINKGGNVNDLDSNREITILMRAIASMKPELVQILLEKKANVNAKVPESGKTALMFFMENYIMESVESGKDTSYIDNTDMLDIFFQLIKAGAKVNEKDFFGKSVLAYAVESTYSSQSEKILTKLLSLKADPNTAFSQDIKKTICQTTVEDTSGNQSLALRLFYSEKTCDPNREFTERNQRVTNPLYLALEKVDKEVVRILLKAGANPNKGASDTMMDYHPLFLCITDYQITELLLKAKANPNSIENQAHILEHTARMVPNDEEGEKIIDLLLQSGSEINHPALFDSYSPYNKAFYAAHIVGKERIEKFLEKRGALRSDQLKKKSEKPLKKVSSSSKK